MMGGQPLNHERLKVAITRAADAMASAMSDLDAVLDPRVRVSAQVHTWHRLFAALDAERKALNDVEQKTGLALELLTLARIAFQRHAVAALRACEQLLDETVGAMPILSDQMRQAAGRLAESSVALRELVSAEGLDAVVFDQAANSIEDAAGAVVMAMIHEPSRQSARSN